MASSLLDKDTSSKKYAPWKKKNLLFGVYFALLLSCV